MALSAGDRVILTKTADNKIVAQKVTSPRSAGDMIILAKTADNKIVGVKMVNPTSADDRIIMAKTADNKVVAVKTAGGGNLYSWGTDDFGQLGRTGDTPNKYTPGLVQFPEEVEIVSAGGGSFNGVAADSNGNLWTWGWNRYGTIGNGSVWPDGPEFYNTPQKITVEGVIFTKVFPGTGSRVMHAADAAGNVYAWGTNHFRQFGDGDPGTAFSYVPMYVGYQMHDMMNGFVHAVGRYGSATYVWGVNTSGGLGLGIEDTNFIQGTPTSLSGGISVSAGAYWTSVHTGVGGSIRSAGRDWSGALGDGDPCEIGDQEESLVAAIGGIPFAKMSYPSGTGNPRGIDSDGDLWGWGGGGLYPELGKSCFPIRVATDYTFTSIATGSGFNMGKESGGTWLSWGRNTDGACGQDSFHSSLPPGPVAVQGFSQVIPMNRFCLAIK